MKNIVLSIVFAASLLLLIGSIGALERNNITVMRCFMQSAIAIAIEWFALKNIKV